jgi:hypothetical protein
MPPTPWQSNASHGISLTPASHGGAVPLPVSQARCPAESGSRRSPPRRFRTRHAGAAGGVVCVGLRLHSGLAMLAVLGFLVGFSSCPGSLVAS